MTERQRRDGLGRQPMAGLFPHSKLYFPISPMHVQKGINNSTQGTEFREVDEACQFI